MDVSSELLLVPGSEMGLPRISQSRLRNRPQLLPWDGPWCFLHLDQWFPAFLILWPVPYVLVTPNHVISLLLPN